PVFAGSNNNTAGHEPAVLILFAFLEVRQAFLAQRLAKAAGWQAFVLYIHCKETT
ncbi:hypothetical protein SAMN04488518_1091, partial [Pseudovibrio ascidiaceicola]